MRIFDLWTRLSIEHFIHNKSCIYLSCVVVLKQKEKEIEIKLKKCSSICFFLCLWRRKERFLIFFFYIHINFSLENGILSKSSFFPSHFFFFSSFLVWSGKKNSWNVENNPFWECIWLNIFLARKECFNVVPFFAFFSLFYFFFL